MQRFTAPLVFALLLVSFVGLVSAQSNPQQLAEANRVAMDAYNNLDIETAKKTLEDAAKGAEKAGVKGPPLARTYSNLGVVCVGGMSDNAAGLDAFVKALQQDPTVEPDPLVSTPEIQQVFMLAKRKAGGGTGPTPAPTKPAPRPQGPIEGNLTHYPAGEQLSQTGVPVYAEAPPDLEVASMEVFYRSLGMARPKSAPMAQMGGGFGYLIPCTDVFEPNVEYFIVAKDAAGTQVGNAGTPQAPISVPVVTERTQPPAALPGQAPPSQCGGGDECPPGMPGCGGKGGLGDTCRADSDCGKDLICADDFCASGEREDDGGDDDGAGGPRFFVDLGFVAGAAYVGRDAEADSAVPQDVVDANPGEEGEAARKAGWDCQFTPAAGGNPAKLSNCTVAVDQPGFVPNFAVQLVAGYFFTPRFYAALNGRLQLGGHGEGSLAGILVGARAGYLVTKPVSKGLMVSLFGGATAGQIQVQPPAQKGGEKGPWVVSGLGGVQLGTSVGYRFTPNIGLVATPQMHFLLPTFLFNLDLMAGIQASF